MLTLEHGSTRHGGHGPVKVKEQGAGSNRVFGTGDRGQKSCQGPLSQRSPKKSCTYGGTWRLAQLLHDVYPVPCCVCMHAQFDIIVSVVGFMTLGACSQFETDEVSRLRQCTVHQHACNLAFRIIQSCLISDVLLFLCCLGFTTIYPCRVLCIRVIKIWNESWWWFVPPRPSKHPTGIMSPTLHVCFAASLLHPGHDLMFEQVMSPMRMCTFWTHVCCSNISTLAASPFPRIPDHAIHGSETQIVGQTNAETSRQDRCGCATLRTDSTQPIHFCGD